MPQVNDLSWNFYSIFSFLILILTILNFYSLNFYFFPKLNLKIFSFKLTL